MAVYVPAGVTVALGQNSVELCMLHPPGTLTPMPLKSPRVFVSLEGHNMFIVTGLTVTPIVCRHDHALI